MTKILDEKKQLVEQTQRRISDAVMRVLDAVNDYKEAIADLIYQEGFNDGVAHVNEEFSRIARANSDVDITPIKPIADMTDAEKLTLETVARLVATSPGLRTSDIISRVVALPIKPQPNEAQIKGFINRLSKENRIRINTGRWYATGAKTKLPDYQVMTYLPDGSKYLGSDILR